MKGAIGGYVSELARDRLCFPLCRADLAGESVEVEADAAGVPYNRL